MVFRSKEQRVESMAGEEMRGIRPRAASGGQLAGKLEGWLTGGQPSYLRCLQTLQAQRPANWQSAGQDGRGLAANPSAMS